MTQSFRIIAMRDNGTFDAEVYYDAKYSGTFGYTDLNQFVASAKKYDVEVCATPDVIVKFPMVAEAGVTTCSALPIGGGSGTGGTKTMWKINTQKDLKGTIEVTQAGLLWSITAPFVRDMNYGDKDMVPATWVDEKGVEQIAVIKENAWGTSDIALDRDRTFGYADAYLDISEVDVVSQTAGYTIQLRYPKGSGILGWALGIAAFGAAVAYIKKAKKNKRR